jgi:hypothetical protein
MTETMTTNYTNYSRLLLKALEDCNEEECKRLINLGADINILHEARDEYDCNLFIMMIRNKDDKLKLELLKLMIDKLKVKHIS